MKEKGRKGEREKTTRLGGVLDDIQARDAHLLSHSPILPFSSSQSDLFTSSPLHPLSHSPVPPFSHSPSPLRGEVHDGNARFLDGVAGHAGLFSTAREVFRIANQFLPGSLLLKPDSLRLFTGNFTRGRGDRRSIGWMLAETPNCSAGPLLPESAFGHTGFTGTSIWVDPVRSRVMVLLTNRIHPVVTDVDMKAARQKFNSLAIEAMDAKWDLKIRTQND